MTSRSFSVLLVLIASGAVCAAETGNLVPVPSTDGWSYPEFILTGSLAESIFIRHCKWISGLTCSIRVLSGKIPPKRLFSTSYAEDGRPLGAEHRVELPQIKPGHTGLATLNPDGRPSRIVLRGE